MSVYDIKLLNIMILNEIDKNVKPMKVSELLMLIDCGATTMRKILSNMVMDELLQYEYGLFALSAKGHSASSSSRPFFDSYGFMQNKLQIIEKNSPIFRFLLMTKDRGPSISERKLMLT